MRRVVQLPPARAADKGFKLLVTDGDRPLDDAWKEHAAPPCCSLADEISPDILLLETYPFGRRQFRFELVPLLESLSRGRPVPSSPHRSATSWSPRTTRRAKPKWPTSPAVISTSCWSMATPNWCPFEATLPAGRHHPRPDPLHRLCRPGPQTRRHRTATATTKWSSRSAAEPSVLPLLRAAIDARPLTALAGIPWRLLAGPDIDEAEFQALRTSAPNGVIVERARPDFPDLLARCTLSISQAGYNTLMDILQARCRAVVVPFAAGNETEQTDRARLFEARGLLHIAGEAGLSAETLAAAIARALEAPPPPPFTPALDGAAATARLLIEAAS